MRNAKSIFCLALLGLAPSAASGQSIETLVKKGETIIGLGAMSTLSSGSLTYMGVNDSKTWMALLGTDFSDPSRDGCIYSNGFVALREGTPLYAPVGSTLDEWNSISLTNRGDLGMILRTKPSVGPSVDGVFRNLVPVVMRTNRIELPPLGPLSTWDSFAVVKMNSNNEMFVLGEIANTALSRSKERSLVRYRLDDFGNVLETTVLATEGMTVPAGLQLLGSSCMGNNEHVLSVNERGDFITYIANDSTGVQALLINMERIVAQTGTGAPLSPVGKPWRVLTNARVALNDRGDYVITGAVGVPGDVDGYLIVKNDQKFAQQGDVLPGFSSNLLAGSGAPLYIANTGDVFWHARVANADSFMRNHEKIVQSGATIIGGNLVTSINAGENGFAISPNGRFWVGSVELQSVGSTALFVDFGLVLELPGCSANPGKLSLVSGKALVGRDFQLAMDDGQAPGAVAILFFSRRPLLSMAGCGIDVPPYGELMLAPPLLGPKSFPNWDGANPSVETIRIPNRISLVDSVFFAQGLFLSAGHPTEPFRLTNAMRIELGAP